MEMLTGLAVLTAVLPVVELRGSIPAIFGLGLNPLINIPLVVIANLMPFFPIFFGLSLFYERALKFNLFRKYVESVRRRGKPYIERYGLVGLILFVAVPLPFTGVYSATLLSWLLGFNWKIAFFTIVAGAILSALVISLMAIGIITLF